MKLQNFRSKLNTRQILVHFIAFWFFIHAFQAFSYLYNTKLLEAYNHSNEKDTFKILKQAHVTPDEVVQFALVVSVSGFIGLLVAVIISLTISIKRRWFWLNTSITFIITYALYKFGLLASTFLNQFFWYFEQGLNNTAIKFLLNGIILLIIGLLIFFLKPSNKFIEQNKAAAV
ncbi:hypothetical protein ACI6Q2_19330 [Chitinophagaceae bacterium LWZ2-11]